MKLVSACLLGINCRYDGSNKLNEKIKMLGERETLIPVCPEQYGGLSIPREPSEIVDGTGKDVLNGKAKVLSKSGKDVTEQFIKGANEVLKIAKLYNINEAILKAKSPSCGSGKIYDGTFTGNLRDGDGVTTALLKENGIKVYTEESFE